MKRIGRVSRNGVVIGSEYVDWFTDDDDACATYRVIMEEQGYQVKSVTIGNGCTFRFVQVTLASERIEPNRCSAFIVFDTGIMAVHANRSRRRSAASSGSKPPDLVFFIDRSLDRKIFAQAPREIGETVEIHDDHFPPDAKDGAWLVGKRGWIVLTKDDRATGH